MLQYFLEHTFNLELKVIRQIFLDSGIDCQAELLWAESSLTDEIISFSREKKSGLIVIMTQQEEDAIESYTGPTARELIRSSELPVLTITPFTDYDHPVPEKSYMKSSNRVRGFQDRDQQVDKSWYV